MKGFTSKDIYNKDITTRIKLEMARNGVTLDSFAKKYDYAQPASISAIINRGGSVEVLEKICNDLSINPRDYFNDGFDV